MSSRVSMPTDSRTRPGVTPVVNCSFGSSWLCVVLAGWIARLRTSPTFARWLNSSRLSMKLRPASTPPFSSNATIAPFPLGRYLSARLPLARLQARVRDPLDLVAPLEPLRHGERVLRMPFHPQAQRLQTLQEQERIERSDRRADVAQVLQAALQHEHRRAKLGRKLREHETVVARIGLGETGNRPLPGSRTIRRRR